uniref:Ion transport domain-containing protein n=1 Tax=Trichuris muris TaxID=70415 RepID=A0A5S6QQH4_TRIMR
MTAIECGRLPVYKYRIYHYLEKPRKTRHTVYQVLVFFFVVTIFCLSHFVSFSKASKAAGTRYVAIAGSILSIFDWLLLSLLLCELALRLWVLDLDPACQGSLGRLRYLLNWRCWTDVLVLSATCVLAVSNCMPLKPQLDNLRLLQILRILLVDRRASAWSILRRVLVLHRIELLASCYLCLIGMLFLATAVYHLEDTSGNSTFTDYGDAIYWSVTTATTVGYGDYTINSWWSKLLTALFCFFLVSLASIQSSVLGVGLACMLQDDELKKMHRKQRPLAATVLQCWWRSCLLRTRFDDIPVYRYEMLQKLLAYEISLGSSTSMGKVRSNIMDNLKARLNTLSGINTVFLKATQRLTLKEQRGRLSKPADSSIAALLFTSGSSDGTSKRSSVSAVRNASCCVEVKNNSETAEGELSNYRPNRLSLELLLKTEESPSTAPFTCSSVDNDGELSISNHHKIALRAVWLWRFFGAKRKFKKTRQYYDFYDVSQQLSESESIQLQELNRLVSRFEMVFGRASAAASPSSLEQDLLSRLGAVESKLDYMNTTLDGLTSSARRMKNALRGNKMEMNRAGEAPGKPTFRLSEII